LFVSLTITITNNNASEVFPGQAPRLRLLDIRFQGIAAKPTIASK
jgi:hypothetical protein